jgi:hypothetical protein
MTEWSLWARPALAVHGRRLVVPRTDPTQFPRDAFPSPEDVKASAPAMLLALLEAPESVAMQGLLPYAFCGWVWIGRSTEDRHLPDPDRRWLFIGRSARLDGPEIKRSADLPSFMSADPSSLLVSESKRTIAAIIDKGWIP